MVAPSSVTDWTGSGWLCRIYLTAALGFAAPFVAWLTFFLLAPAASKRKARDRPDLPISTSSSEFLVKSQAMVGRVVVFALLCMLPVLVLQAAIAWISVWVKYQGAPIESQPRSVIGYFLATYWYGTPEQCGTAATCTLCVFPAAAAIVHLVWTFVFLLCVWDVGARLCITAINRSIKRRLKILVAFITLASIAGVATVGASVAWGPFTWANQGCWLGYVASIATMAGLLTWEVVVVPVHAAHAAARRAKKHQIRDAAALTHAQVVVASDKYNPMAPVNGSLKRTSYLGNNNDDDDGLSAGGVLMSPLGDGLRSGIAAVRRPPSASSSRSYNSIPYSAGPPSVTGPYTAPYAAPYASAHSPQGSIGGGLQLAPIRAPLPLPSAPPAPPGLYSSGSRPTSSAGLPPSPMYGWQPPHPYYQGGQLGVGYPYHAGQQRMHSRASSAWSMGSWGSPLYPPS